MDNDALTVGEERTARKGCWQCHSRKQKVIQPASYKNPAPKVWACINDCGPESLGKLFRF